MKDAAELVKMNGGSPYISTIAGRNFYADAPTFDTAEIAHALAMKCRFGGHVTQFYSVAEHSCLVAHIMARANLGNPLEGLMHDASEAYLADVPAPWKPLLPDYVALEKRMDAAMRVHYRLPAAISDGCKRADWLALFIEAEALVPSKGLDFFAPHGIRAEAQRLKIMPQCWAPQRACAEFLGHFQVLDL